MKKSELFQNIDTLMTEVLELKKSWDDKMEKAEDEPSDAQDDAVHMADHGADEESLAEYAKKLSDEELHELISSLVQEAEGRGGDEGEESESPEMPEEGEEEGEDESEQEEPEMEKAGEEDEAMQLPEQDADGMQEQEEPEGDLGSKVAELSDEEIQTLMSAIQAEMGNRKGGAGGGMGGMGGVQKSEEKSEHDEKMEKSLKAALKKIDELSAQVDAFRKSQSKKVERKESIPTQKYADPKITVLEKSAQDDSKVVMTGATLANWLISEQAAGNKKVNSDLVTKANLSKSVEDASEFYKELERIGIKAPRS